MPEGPGVRPPFAAPPVYKQAGTVALWSVLGAVTLLLCLVGGGIGAGGAVVTAFNETDREARTTAAKYLDAIVDGRFAEAYRMTCKPLQRRIDESDFVERKQRSKPVVGYELSTVQPMSSGRLMVPAELRHDTGKTTRIGLVMDREAVGGATAAPDATSRFRVCGEVDDPGPTPS